MRKTAKIGLVMGLAYLIDRISYPDKYKKKELEITGELKYTTSTGEVISKKIDLNPSDRTVADKIKNERVPKYQCSIDDPDVWLKNQKKIDSIVARAERYYEKAEDCKDREKAISYYRESIENYSKATQITHQPYEYRELLKVCWASNLIDEVEKHLNVWLKEIPNDNDAHGNLARLFIYKKDIGNAKAEYIKTISLNPRDYNYCDELAKLYLDEGDYQKAIEAYKIPLEYFREDPYAGINLYEVYIKLCLKYNVTNLILKMIPEIFIKLDEMISGRRKATIYQEQDPEFYIAARKGLGRNIGSMLEREVKTHLKDNNISKAKELVESFNSILQDTRSNELQFLLNILKAKIFRKEQEFNKSWPLYNQSMPLCDGNRDFSLLYTDMGEQLFEENKIKGSIGLYLYAITFTEKYPPAISGLKKALKKNNLIEHFDSLLAMARQTKSHQTIKDYIERTIPTING